MGLNSNVMINSKHDGPPRLSIGGESATIKSHHNVGGLPDHVDFKEIVEPLRYLFKDEERSVGLHLGIPEELVMILVE